MAKGAVYKLTGNTYPYRAEIREIGGTWNAEQKCWMVVAPSTMRERATVSATLHSLRKHGIKVETV